MARLLIAGATLVDTVAPSPDPQQRNLLLEDGRIEAWLAPDEPAEGERLDATGLYAIPGLLDLHFSPFLVGAGADVLPHQESVARDVQRAMRALPVWLSGGTTTACTVGAWDNLDLELRDWVNAGKMPAPRLFAAGTAIGAYAGGAWSQEGLLLEVSGPDEARRAARQQIKAGVDALVIQADWPGVGSRWQDHAGSASLDLDEIRAIVEEADHAGVVCCASALGERGAGHCARAGVRALHLTHAPSERLLAAMAGCGTTWVPALAGAAWAAEGADLPNSEDAPADWLSAAARAIQGAVGLGVPVAVGSNARELQATPVQECAHLVLAGLTPYQALQAATALAAAVLDPHGGTGSLLPGRRADIVLLEADPLADIANLARVRAVIHNGVLVGQPQLP